MAQSPQKAAKDNLKIAIKDTTAWLRGFQVMVDLVGPIEMAAGSHGQYEAGARLNLRDRYFPVVELGIGKADHDDIVTGTRYYTRSPYARIGADFNVLRNKHDIYRFYAGFRYAFTSYKFDIFHPDVVDPVWGGSTPFAAKGVSANYGWIEGVVSIDAKIWKMLHLGWSLRYKRRLHHNDGNMGNVWYVPGYGIQGSSRLGGTFNVIFDF